MVSFLNKRNVELLFGKVHKELPPPSENKEIMIGQIQIGNQTIPKAMEVSQDDVVFDIFRRKGDDKLIVFRYCPKDGYPLTVTCNHGRMVLPFVSLSVLPIGNEDQDCLEFYKYLIMEASKYAKTFIIPYRSKVYKVPAIMVDSLYLRYSKVTSNSLTKTVFIPVHRLKPYAL